MKNLLFCAVAVLGITAAILGGYYGFVSNPAEETEVEQNQEAEVEKEGSGATDTEWGHRWLTDAWRDENGVVSADGLANAVAQRDAYLAEHKPYDGLGENGIKKMNWISRGPQNVGGRTRSLVIDSTSRNGQTMWAGAVSGGVWRSDNGGNTWSATNGGLQNFAVNSMAFDIDPISGQKTLWAGTGDGYSGDGLTGGGLFRSTDGGVTWEVKSRTVLRKWQHINSIAVSHHNGETILLVGMDSPPPNPDRGVMRSTDGGDNWTQVVDGETCLSVVFDPGNPRNAVAEIRSPPDKIDTNRVVFSTNCGYHSDPCTWQTAVRSDPTRTPTSTATPTATATPSSTPTQTSTGTPTPSPSLTPTVEPTVEQELIPSPPPFETNSAARIVKLAYFKSDSNIVYANDGDYTGQPSQISKSEDGGHSYTTYQRTGIPEYFYTYMSSFWVSPTDPNLIVSGGNVLYRSIDGGLGFNPISEYAAYLDNRPHADQQFAVSASNYSEVNRKVYVTNDGGIYRTNDIKAMPTPVWEQANTKYQTTQFYSAAGDAASGIIIGGTQDNCILRLRSGNQNADGLSYSCDGGKSAVDGEICYGQSNGPLIRSLNCNAAFPISRPITADISDYDFNAVFLAPMRVDQMHPNRFFFGGSSVWRSDNVNTPNHLDVTWTEIKVNPPIYLSIGEPYKPTRITAMDVYPTHPEIVWVAEMDVHAPYYEQGRLYKTTNATASSPDPTPEWTQMDNNSPPLPDRMILKILMDPGNSDTVYVGFAGGSPNGNGEDNLWRTENGGENWTDITGGSANCDPDQPSHGLPCVPVNAIAIDPYNSAKIYVGTDIGIYVTENVEAANPNDIVWEPVMNGPANVKISDLNYLKNSNTLLAATYGRGLWTANLLPPVYPKHSINDFDGDGRSDIAVVREDGSDYIWHKDGTNEGYSSVEFGAAGDQIAPADYDGDGKVDMAFYRPSETKWYSLMSSTNTVATTTLANVDGLTTSGDFDGDGMDDEGIFDTTTGDWHVEQSANGHLDFHWGALGDTPVSVDFNGDGAADFGVFHEADGMQTLSYLDAGVERQQQFGLEGDIPVSGDYDGDAKADIAFWRPDDDGDGNGCWYITYAANEFVGYDEIPWGLSGDVPVPGDYDGDGKMDVAIWRPSDGMWHILESSNGYYSQLFGADGDTPVGRKGSTYASRPGSGGFQKAPPGARPERRGHDPIRTPVKTRKK